MSRTWWFDSNLSLDGNSRQRQIYVMSDLAENTVHLRRIDPTQNMRRFYCLTLQPTLFGGASVIREWVRIGTRGQSMMETFDQVAEAEQLFKRQLQRKIQRGYRVPREGTETRPDPR
jgi:predicted DNA-binding WGR domain protein